MGLGKLLNDLMGSSFDDLRATNRAAGAKLSKLAARQFIEDCALFSGGANQIREQLLSRIDGPFDQRAREECGALLDKAIRLQKLGVRPGNVETLWFLEGVFDRFLVP